MMMDLAKITDERERRLAWCRANAADYAATADQDWQPTLDDVLLLVDTTEGQAARYLGVDRVSARPKIARIWQLMWERQARWWEAQPATTNGETP